MYRVILADPPWNFQNYSAKGEGRHANRHYRCLSLDAIKALPVEAVADRNAALFLWTTGPFMDEAFAVMRAWGFTYKTVAFVWIKPTRAWYALLSDLAGWLHHPCLPRVGLWHWGTGYWTRANAEFVLLGTRGEIGRADAGVHQIICAPVGAHSAKPEEVYQHIERLTGPQGRRLELFARVRHPGWDSLGDGIDGEDIGDGLRRLALAPELT